MSKNHRINKSHKEGHFINDEATVAAEEQAKAPAGLERTTEAQLTQGTVFDAIEDVEDSSSKAQCYNTLVYRAGFALVMAAHSLLKNNGFDLRMCDTDDHDDPVVAALYRNARVFNYCSDEALTYATNAFEKPQGIEAILASAIKQRTRKPKALTAAEREALGLSEPEAVAAQARAQRRAENTAHQLGESIEEHRHEILGMVQNILGNVGNDVPTANLTADQHDGLYEAVVNGLERNRARSIDIGLEYDGEFREMRFSDAREFNAARKVIEKHRAAFRRANLAELRYAA